MSKSFDQPFLQSKIKRKKNWRNKVKIRIFKTHKIHTGSKKPILEQKWIFCLKCNALMVSFCWRTFIFIDIERNMYVTCDWCPWVLTWAIKAILHLLSLPPQNENEITTLKFWRKILQFTSGFYEAENLVFPQIFSLKFLEILNL